jgi:RNA polymerase-binding transcription factor DksA
MDAHQTPPGVAKEASTPGDVKSDVVEHLQQAATIDLDAVAQDLADVELALARLDTGTYWIDEVTGEALTDELMADQPTARRVAGA